MKYSYEDVDRRIDKTKYVLSITILDSIKGGVNNSVTSICKKARVSRLTYYRHFNNKEDLLQYAVCKQLEGILPIPNKLKPINLKHLVYYLINSLSLFVKNNQQLIWASLQQLKNTGFKGSYLFLVVRTSTNLIRKEIAILLRQNNYFIDLVNSIICGSILNLFLQMIIRSTFINPTTIWNTFKSVNVLLK